MDVNVDTNRGTLTLHGEVRTEAERQLAGKVAEDVSGVKNVVNELHVRG
jgi:hyperosmotically inducible periplasmic protein